MRQDTEVVSSSFPQSKLQKIRNYHSLIITVVILLIVIGIGVGLSLTRTTNNGPACSKALIGQAASDFSYNRLSQLSSVTSKIQGKSNYKKDPNCMYIITTYYYNEQNGILAENSLKQFNDDYTNKSVVSTKLTSYDSIANLRQEVAGQYKLSEAAAQNSAKLSPVSPNVNTSRK